MKKLDRALIESLILNVQKPARYLGGELNSIVKEEAEIRAAICYPDLYDVGMSNNGIRVLYNAANRIDGVACERVFAVQDDFESLLRDRGLQLFTLETLTPLAGLDAIGFNLSHELLYSNLLQVLDLGGIPLLASDRGEDSPLVMAGGSAASNPFPVSDFIDLFFVGDGEDGFPEILLSMKELKKSRAGRMEKLKRLSEIEGVFVPSFSPVRYDGGKITEVTGKPVHKRIYKGSGVQNPLRPLVPNIRITQGRAVYEVARGCGNFCRFCHAGYYDLPYRSHPHDVMAGEIFEIIANTGYDELSLSALSISDYRYMTPLLNRILPGLSEKGVSISLPSLRVDMRTLPLIEKISDLRKTSLTFAVESGSEEIRRISNKRISDDDLYSIVEHVFRSGWKLIKLYFMMGLPGCRQYDEAGAIISMLKRVKSAAGSGSEINVTLSPFVPKPHTPFQREEQFGPDYFFEVIDRVKKGVHRSIKIKNHDVASSILEGVFSRGDSRLGRVILASYRDGCRFDSWKEKFHFGIWKKNLDLLIPDWNSYLAGRPQGDILPWDIIATGFEKVLKSMEAGPEDAAPSGAPTGRSLPEDEPLDSEGFRKAGDNFRLKYRVMGTARIRVKKSGVSRFIPHLDYIEVIKRGCRMAGLPVSFSQGFNKRERMSFGYPVPLGIESNAELFDIDLYDAVPVDIEERFRGRFPDGMEFISWRALDRKESLMAVTSMLEYHVYLNDGPLFQKICGNLVKKISFDKVTKNGLKHIGFDSIVVSHEVRDDLSLKIRLHAGTPESLRVDHVMTALAEIPTNMIHEIRIVKENQFRADGSEIY